MQKTQVIRRKGVQKEVTAAISLHEEAWNIDKGPGTPRRSLRQKNWMQKTQVIRRKEGLKVKVPAKPKLYKKGVRPLDRADPIQRQKQKIQKRRRTHNYTVTKRQKTVVPTPAPGKKGAQTARVGGRPSIHDREVESVDEADSPQRLRRRVQIVEDREDLHVKRRLYANNVADVSQSQDENQSLSRGEDRESFLIQDLKTRLSHGEKAGSLTIYRMPGEVAPGNKWELGTRKNKNNKVLMFIGDNRSSKTSLINTMINYIFGVQWGDAYRIKLIDDRSGEREVDSQVPHIMTYHINHGEALRIPFSLTIIDVRWLRGTRGRTYDEENMQQIKDFFAHSDLMEIDAICFSTSSSLASLTSSEMYMYKNISSMFGKDNIVFFTSSADQQQPNFLSTDPEGTFCRAQPEDVFPMCFSFCNAVTYTDNCPQEDDDDCMVHEIQWSNQMRSIQKFLLHVLPKQTGKDLSSMKKIRSSADESLDGLVISSMKKKRPSADESLDELVSSFEEMICKQEALEDIKKTLREFKEDIEKNKSVVFEESGVVRKKITTCENAIMCHLSDSISHQNPYILHIKLVSFCEGFSFRKFKVEKRCSVYTKDTSRHYEENYYWQSPRNIRKETISHIKERYENLLDDLKTDIEKAEEEAQILIRKISEGLKHLQDPTSGPLSAENYFQLLIETEIREGKDSYLNRVDILDKAKRRCKAIANIESQGATQMVV
ncbi:uncharacterized protein [Hyperolius riggenbachi]